MAGSFQPKPKKDLGIAQEFPVAMRLRATPVPIPNTVVKP